MAPQQKTEPAQLQGGSTTTVGVLAIIMGSLGLFSHIWSVAHGGQLDPVAVSATAGSVATGIGLVKAADAKQVKQ